MDKLIDHKTLPGLNIPIIPGLQAHAFYAAFKENADRWLFPEEPWEPDMAKQLARLKPRPLIQIPKQDIEYMRMKMGECHVNCHFYAKNNPDWKHIAVWLINPEAYALHSVIRHKSGVVRCITPFLHGAQMFYALDPKLKIRFEDDKDGMERLVIRRSGQKIGVGVRRNPKDVIAKVKMQMIQFEELMLSQKDDVGLTDAMTSF